MGSCFTEESEETFEVQYCFYTLVIHVLFMFETCVSLLGMDFTRALIKVFFIMGALLHLFLRGW